MLEFRTVPDACMPLENTHDGAALRAMIRVADYLGHL
jgi:hypothetical protein